MRQLLDLHSSENEKEEEVRQSCQPKPTKKPVIMKKSMPVLAQTKQKPRPFSSTAAAPKLLPSLYERQLSRSTLGLITECAGSYLRDTK